MRGSKGFPWCVAFPSLGPRPTLDSIPKHDSDDLFFCFFLFIFLFFLGQVVIHYARIGPITAQPESRNKRAKVVVSPRFWSVFVVLLVPDLCKSSIPSLDSVTNPVVRHRTRRDVSSRLTLILG